MYPYIYTCIVISIYLSIYLFQSFSFYVCIHTHTHTHTHTYIYIYIYIFVSLFVSVYLILCIYQSIYLFLCDFYGIPVILLLLCTDKTIGSIKGCSTIRKILQVRVMSLFLLYFLCLFSLPSIFCNFSLPLFSLPLSISLYFFLFYSLSLSLSEKPMSFIESICSTSTLYILTINSKQKYGWFYPGLKQMMVVQQFSELLAPSTPRSMGDFITMYVCEWVNQRIGLITFELAKT